MGQPNKLLKMGQPNNFEKFCVWYLEDVLHVVSKFHFSSLIIVETMGVQSWYGQGVFRCFRNFFFPRQQKPTEDSWADGTSQQLELVGLSLREKKTGCSIRTMGQPNKITIVVLSLVSVAELYDGRTRQLLFCWFVPSWSMRCELWAEDTNWAWDSNQADSVSSIWWRFSSSRDTMHKRPLFFATIQ